MKLLTDANQTKCGVTFRNCLLSWIRVNFVPKFISWQCASNLTNWIALPNEFRRHQLVQNLGRLISIFYNDKFSFSSQFFRFLSSTVCTLQTTLSRRWQKTTPQIIIEPKITPLIFSDRHVPNVPQFFGVLFWYKVKLPALGWAYSRIFRTFFICNSVILMISRR